MKISEMKSPVWKEDTACLTVTTVKVGKDVGGVAAKKDEYEQMKRLSANIWSLCDREPIPSDYAFPSVNGSGDQMSGSEFSSPFSKVNVMKLNEFLPLGREGYCHCNVRLSVCLSLVVILNIYL